MALKLSCPSYIIPGTWWENITYIDENRPEISNVELLFFIYDDQTRRLIAPEEKLITSYTGRLTFTVHLPDPFLPGHLDLVEKTSGIAKHYILHPPEKGFEDEFAEKVEVLRKNFGDRFLLENLIGRNHQWFIKNTDWPLCLDTGHALLRGHSPVKYYNKFRDRIKEIHLHDVINGMDHSPLSKESIWLREFISELNNFRGIVNIELFREKEVLTSLEVIQTLFPYTV